MTVTVPITILAEWAKDATSVDDITIPPRTSSPTVANQAIGFPPAQEEDPAGGGEYVKRAEMNGVFQLLSLWVNSLSHGVPVTIQPAIIANGGYDLGVMLWCPAKNNFQRSLVNNNIADFTITPSYADDNINWTSALNVSTLTTQSDIIALLGQLKSSKFNWDFKSNPDARSGVSALNNIYNTEVALIATGTTLGGLEVRDSGQTRSSDLLAFVGDRFRMVTSGVAGSGIPAINSPCVVQSDFNSVIYNPSGSNTNIITNIYTGSKIGFPLNVYATISGEVTLSFDNSSIVTFTLSVGFLGLPATTRSIKGVAYTSNNNNLPPTIASYCRLDDNIITVASAVSVATSGTLAVNFAITYSSN